MFYGHTDLLMSQLLGIVTIAIYTLLTASIVLLPLHKYDQLRITAEDEELGVDKVDSGGDAY